MKETPRARAAFTDYVSLGDGRSLERLLERYQSVSGTWPTRRLNTLKQWSAAHNWQVRIAALIEQQEAEAAEHWARVREEHRNRMLLTGQALLGRADEMLRWPIATRTVTQGENGEQIVTLTPARWSFSDAARMVEVADKLVRLAAEMDLDRIKVTVEDVRRAAKQIGVPEEDLARLADAMARGEDIVALAEAIANGRDRPRPTGQLPGASMPEDDRE